MRTSACDGTEELQDVRGRIAVGEHGDLRLDLADLVHAHGFTEHVGGGIFVVICFLGIACGEEAFQVGLVDDVFEEGGIGEGFVAFEAFDARAVFKIFPCVVRDEEGFNIGTDGDSRVAFLVEEEDVVVKRDFLGLIIALRVVETIQNAEAENVVMNVRIDFGVGSDGEAHVGHFGCAAPCEEDGVVGEFEFHSAIFILRAEQVAGLHAVVDEEVVENLHIAFVMADLDAVVGGVQEDAVLDGQITGGFALHFGGVDGRERRVAFRGRIEIHTGFNAFGLAFDGVVAVRVALIDVKTADDGGLSFQCVSLVGGGPHLEADRADIHGGLGLVHFIGGFEHRRIFGNIADAEVIGITADDGDRFVNENLSTGSFSVVIALCDVDNITILLLACSGGDIPFRTESGHGEGDADENGQQFFHVCSFSDGWILDNCSDRQSWIIINMELNIHA